MVTSTHRQRGLYRPLSLTGFGGDHPIFRAMWLRADAGRVLLACGLVSASAPGAPSMVSRLRMRLLAVLLSLGEFRRVDAKSSTRWWRWRRLVSVFPALAIVASTLVAAPQPAGA